MAAPNFLSRAAEQPTVTREFARDVIAGLSESPKKLHARYLYDPLGSALFEAITVLPEYGLTRAEERVLRRHAREIAHRLAPVELVAELGSGSGRKTRPILQAFTREQPSIQYGAIDVSSAALADCSRQLSTIPNARILSYQRSYLDGLREIGRKRTAGNRLLVLFLGSSIGNFEGGDALNFLRQVRQTLRPGDALLLGTDLAQDPAQLIPAYDDPTGVTAAFNKNLLARINRELDADFDLRQFRHEARWNQLEHRVEMHLVSLATQTVEIQAAGIRVSFAPNESIWTESCHKFDARQVERLASTAGFEPLAQWVDGEWPFAENLWIAA